VCSSSNLLNCTTGFQPCGGLIPALNHGIPFAIHFSLHCANEMPRSSSSYPNWNPQDGQISSDAPPGGGWGHLSSAGKPQTGHVYDTMCSLRRPGRHSWLFVPVRQNTWLSLLTGSTVLTATTLPALSYSVGKVLPRAVTVRQRTPGRPPSLFHFAVRISRVYSQDQQRRVSHQAR